MPLVPSKDLYTHSTVASAREWRGEPMPLELSPATLRNFEVRMSARRSVSLAARGHGLPWMRGKARGFSLGPRGLPWLALESPTTKLDEVARLPGPARRLLSAFLRESVGSGSFGTVFMEFNPDTLQISAVKESLLDESHNSKYGGRLNSELEICKTLRHPHIVSYLGHDYTDQHLCIYLEYVAGGSVASILSEFGPFDIVPLRKATHGMLEGLNYLHTLSPPIVHRNIKGAKVLVDLEFCVKLSDFGYSKTDSLSSIPWMAPEVICQAWGHSRKADIWSFGCTVIEMASAEEPWGNGIFNNLLSALRHIALSSEIPPIPESVPGSCDDLIRRCVQRSQHERPNTGKLLEHEFFGPMASKPPTHIRQTKAK